ncbi:prepilin-type N-terminal cleavage/methylation domain-containing protein [Sulfurimonas sp. SWIR-19]|uniref:prepilin-type N-terminal cleavage/methylation domain-containing protein n=1 Tax=Sulfurimonas sp. SWIR-19 TaxID=2878390 RepID=UPI001CF25CA3|nr:prepilin-type N-terminal cleavage/methylation domain-containing protein [Sulfurimonas sp. SWIR-19]UCN00588.1 prepilin-type N-terminal cleavage/methylation domain-containing protein [Sulfurimonas sp. SWIR-19]
MKRKAFTLVELLVVLVIMTVVLGVVVPIGSKMLSRFEGSLNKNKELQNLSKMRADSFITLQEHNVTVGIKEYRTTKRGVVIETSQYND